MRFIDGYLPEEDVLAHYLGDYRSKFTEVYVTTESDALAFIWRTDQNMPADSVEARGLGRIRVSYVANKESIAISIRMIDAIGQWWKWLTYVHLADPKGEIRVQKLIQLFGERTPPNSLRYGIGAWELWWPSVNLGGLKAPWG